LSITVVVFGCKFIISPPLKHRQSGVGLARATLSTPN
jgi:hypothetical protein